MGAQLSVVPKDIDHLKQEITQEWQRAEKGAEAVIAAFLRIGKCILLAEEHLGSGTADYQSFLNELPFSY